MEHAGSPSSRVRRARPDELVLLPEVESAADTLFEPLGIGPLPGPGTVEELAGALVVLVAGAPPVGFCRIDGISGDGISGDGISGDGISGDGIGGDGIGGDGIVAGAHLEQISVHPDHAGNGIGRALLRAACAWAAEQGYAEITLATYSDVPWNGPFYASEGFVERGSADDFLRTHGLPPEEPVLGLFGTRVLMVRSL